MKLNAKLSIGVAIAAWLCGAEYANSAPQELLFICGGNTGRSPMAEGLVNAQLQKMHNHQYVAVSRGADVDPNAIMPEPNAVIAMQQKGIDISKHRAAEVTVADIDQATLVLTMTDVQKKTLIALDPKATAKIKTLSECASGVQQNVADPYGQALSVYVKTRNQIQGYIQQLAKHGFQCVVQSS